MNIRRRTGEEPGKNRGSPRRTGEEPGKNRGSPRRTGEEPGSAGRGIFSKTLLEKHDFPYFEKNNEKQKSMQFYKNKRFARQNFKTHVSGNRQSPKYRKSFLGLYIPIYSYVFLYIPIHSYTFLYIPIHSYTFLYIPIHSYTFLYIPIHSYTFLYSYCRLPPAGLPSSWQLAHRHQPRQASTLIPCRCARA